MQVSQKNIADALDVSIITVSRALRNHPDLAEDTRAKILRKAEELGYRRSKPRPVPAPKRVGVLLYDEEGPRNEMPLDSGIKRNIFLELQKECQRNQVETMIETPSPHGMPLVIRNGTVQAAFLFGRYTPESISFLKNIPVLAVSSFILCDGVPRIVADNTGGMSEVTEHLIKLGHRRILFLAQNEHHTQLHAERTNGYVVAMHRYGLRPEVVPCNHASLPMEQIKRYEAIACSSDSLAYAVQERQAEAGRHAPTHYSIVAFDHLTPSWPLTTYGPDWNLMGRLAADMLLSQAQAIRGRNVVITVPGQLINRNSTRPA